MEMNLPSRTAKASAVENAESTVYTNALCTIRSACLELLHERVRNEQAIASVVRVLFVMRYGLVVLFHGMYDAIGSLHILMDCYFCKPFILE